MVGVMEADVVGRWWPVKLGRVRKTAGCERGEAADKQTLQSLMQLHCVTWIGSTWVRHPSLTQTAR